MRLQIRTKVFETNSSSVHSLTFDPSGLELNKMSMDKDGYILASFGEFGKNTETYSSQADKLSYLLTCLYYSCAHFDAEEVVNTYGFSLIERALQKYTGCNGIRIIGDIEPYIDHQSIPENGDVDLINIWSEGAIIDFIFNKYVMLHTTCD